MGDGTDRARRDSTGGSGGRRSAVRDGDVDDVLARHGLVGGGAGSDPGGRRRRPETDDANQPASGPNGARRRRAEPEDVQPLAPGIDGTGGRRRHAEPDEPVRPAGDGGSGRRRRAAEEGRPADTVRRGSPGSDHSWPPTDDRTTGRRRRPEPDAVQPATESTGGRRRRPEPDERPAGWSGRVESTGGRRRRAEPDEPEPRPAIESTGGRRRRPDPDEPPSAVERTGGRRRRPEPDEEPPQPGGRRRRPDDPAEHPEARRRAPDQRLAESGGHRRADRAARHAPPGPHVDDLGGPSAGGTGNFLDESTARGRAALESSGALQRTSAVAPGWVRANDRQNGAEAHTRFSGRTGRDTAPTAKVPAVGGRTNGRRAAWTDQATTALPARGRERAGSPADGPSRNGAGSNRVLPPEPLDDEPDGRVTHADATAEARARENGAQRVARIDETLTRLTAAHAGLELASDRDDDDDDDDDLPPPRPRLTPLRLICLLLAVVVLGASGAGFATRFWLGRAVPTVAALDARSNAVTDAAAQKGAANVLIVAGERETIPGTGSRDATTFAIAHVPAGGGSVTVLSLPAELEINRPPCERFDPISREYATQPVPAEARTQLASALAVGGPRCVTRVVQQLTGLAVTSYLGVDLDELARLADAVGGVGVCLTRPVVDDALGPIVPQTGTQKLGGEHTLDYLQAAEVVGDPASGAGRVERQQGVLAAALTPLLSTTGLLDIGRLVAARAVLGRTLTVDGLDLDQVHATARSLHKLDADGVRFVAAPTMTGPSGGASLVLRDAEAADLFSAMRTDKPLPAAAGAATAAGPQPGDVPVQVLNASDRSGLANQIADTLKQLGFGVGETGNAAQRTAQTIIRYSPDREAAAKLLAGSVPSATTVPNPGSTGVLQLVLGRSFDDVVRPPTSAVPAADAPQAATGSAQCS